MMLKSFHKFSLPIFIIGFCLAVSPVFSEEEKPETVRKPIEINGDQVEFFADAKKAVAEGNVVINYQDSKLTCNKVTVYTDTKDVVAEGDVHLYTSKGEIAGQNLKYNFEKKAGIIYDGKFTSVPFYGAGKSIEKINAQEMRANEAYMTTCDLEKPHFRMLSKEIQIFPGDKMIAKQVTVRAGDLPIFYIPQYIQPLDDKRPRVTLMPGYDKTWGAYLFQYWRYYFNENAKGTIHLDYREKKSFAWGVDHSYKMVNFGEGLIRTYYTNERSLKKHFWIEQKSAVKERFKGEWRHKWQISPTTQAIWQYYKLSDKDFLNDYFEKEHEKDPEPKSYFLLTQILPSATLSFDVEKRVNHFFATLEKLPEIKLETIDQRIGDSRFYFKNQTSYATLSYKTAQPAATDPKGKQTERVDSYNQFSRQDKVGFIETHPYIGFRQTYYSRDMSGQNTNLVRGAFYSGVDLSTKFYRLFNIDTDFAKLDINKIRHIITPTISYAYIHPPTISPSKFFPFDGIDTLDRKNQVTLSLENKLQTKRSGASVDLLRLAFNTSRTFKQKPKGTRFNNLRTDLEIKPYDWLNLSADSDYDMRLRKYTTAHIDLSASGGDKWNFGVGQSYQRGVSNQTTAEVAYRLNPKWKFRAYERFEALTGSLKEQEYTLYRDLHCWTLEFSYNSTRGEGNSIWIIFRLKAFPEMGLEFNNSYNRRKVGSQSLDTK